MSARQILQTFDAWRQLDQPMVLATVYETLGSTYSKAGHRILIAANGDYQGLVSGGCLEGDLAERAREVLGNNEAVAISYDLRDEADDLWGLGVGCNGLIRVFLQPLISERDYQPFNSIAQRLLENRSAVVATIIDSGETDLEPGSTLIWTSSSSEQWGLDSTAANRLIQACREVAKTGDVAYRREEAGVAVLYSPLKPVPRLLVLGAGLDAIPVVNLAVDLGWLVTVADHRPAYIERGGFGRAEQALTIDPNALTSEVELHAFDAVIVMSHHLVTDRTYLGQLAAIDYRYLGVLGPPARKERLLTELGDVGDALRSKLKGPVGLDIGADSPESIALSIVAELQAKFAGYPRTS